jgi:hypothetical protein
MPIEEVLPTISALVLCAPQSCQAPAKLVNRIRNLGYHVEISAAA